MRSKLILGFCIFLASSVLSAQTISTSQIRGVIQDASGAAVAGAQIKLTSTSTGAVRTAVSGADGSYLLPDLSVGSYTLEVTKEGFSKYVQTGIVLQVGGNPTINVALQVGAVTQEVTVKPRPRWWKPRAPVSAKLLRPRKCRIYRSTDASSPTC